MSGIFVPHHCCWFYRSWAESFMCRSDQMSPDSRAKPACSVSEGCSLGYMVHCYCQLAEKNMPITDWVPHCIFINLPRLCLCPEGSSELGEAGSQQRESICLQEAKGNSSRSRAKTPPQLCSVLPQALSIRTDYLPRTQGIRWPDLHPSVSHGTAQVIKGQLAAITEDTFYGSPQYMQKVKMLVGIPTQKIQKNNHK